MLTPLLAITRKELQIFFKDPSGLALNFIMPLAFIVVMSFALSSTFDANAGGAERRIQVLVVNEDRGPRAAEVIAALQAEDGLALETELNGAGLTRAAAEVAVRDRVRGAAIVFPADFSDVLDQPLDAEPRLETQVELLSDPGASSQFIQPIAAALQGFVSRQLAAGVPDKLVAQLVDTLFAAAPDAQRDSIKAQSRTRASEGMADVARVTLTYPGGMVIEKRPTSFQQNIPGYTVFGVFWIVQQLALSVVREKRDGASRRLLAAPIARGVIVAGKLLPYFLINLLQVIVMLGMVGAVFGLDLGGSPAGLLAVSVAMAFAATGMGILVAAFVSSEAQVLGLTTLLLIVLAALGGCFVPSYLMPDWMRAVSLITPHGWALQAYVDLIARGRDLVAVLPAVGVLSGFGVLFLTVGVLRFRLD